MLWICNYIILIFTSPLRANSLIAGIPREWTDFSDFDSKCWCDQALIYMRVCVLTTDLLHFHISTLSLNRSQRSMLIIIYRIVPWKTLLTFLPDDNQCRRLCVVWQVINYLFSLNKQPQVQASPSILWVCYLLMRARVFVARGYTKYHIKDSKSWCN